MRRIGLAAFAARLAVGLMLFVPCASAYSQQTPQEPQVDPEQKVESAAPQGPGVTPEVLQPTIAVPAVPGAVAVGVESQPERARIADSGSEYWPEIYGYRFKVTDSLLVGFTFLLFLATVALFFATRALVRDARISSRRELRAYVSATSATIDELDGGAGIVTAVTIRNSGKTPAFKVVHIGRLLTTPYPPATDLAFEPKLQHQPSRGILGPGVESHHFQQRQALTATESAALQNGTMAIYVDGQVQYEDAFGISRYTTYRYLIGGPHGIKGNSMATSEIGNEAS